MHLIRFVAHNLVRVVYSAALHIKSRVLNLLVEPLLNIGEAYKLLFLIKTIGMFKRN
jgi:hypothetical protein